MKKLELKVYVDFNPETNTFENPKVFLEGVAEKVVKTRTKKTAEKKEESKVPTLVREDNKLVFNNAAIELLGVTNEDRISIRYQEVEGNKKVPVIGNDIYFGDKGNGNKLTKSNTVAFRGKSNEILEEFGTTFTFEPTKKDGIFFLKSDKINQIVDNNIEEDQAIAEQTLDIQTEADEEFDLTVENFDI